MITLGGPQERKDTSVEGHNTFRAVPAALLALALLACGDGVVRPDWSVKVQATTSGEDPDLDGYEVVIDDGRAVDFLAANGSATFELDEGSHSIELSGLSENCTVRGANPVSVNTRSREFVTVTFEVICSPLPGA